ncbi:MAG: ParB/RepB/Spo0J family partition protein, partial [Clostridiaceae bacterium]|nr:ParB/RepB/Spo0J family partition protein [Clostridiaceae bacterium]
MARKGLGRGLGALLPDYDENLTAQSQVVELKVIDIEPNEEQPRQGFDVERLTELADSIKAHGIIQPILVAKNDESYKIIAGERRWRAAKLAGLKTVPAIIRDYDESTLFQVSLIENLQRADLNPIEEANGYKTLTKKFGLTQDEISKRVGKSRSAITNALRLLTLPNEVISLIENATLSTGHAKVLLSLPSEKLQKDAAKLVVEKKLSVRDTEKYVRELLKG